ncbi:MAG: hypothetical protein ABIO04_08690 [Ferruginibacter sp.]
MRTSFFILSIFMCTKFLHAQELFVYSEPASNMPAKSIGIRLTNNLVKQLNDNYEEHLQTEIMWGISKKIMVHAEGFFSNKNKSFRNEGGAIYIKYRFYSADEVHSHFRMAAFARGAYNNSEIHDNAIELNGYNSGYEAGLVATKLLNKLAISSTAYISHATENGHKNKFSWSDGDRNALSYSLSAGRLILPVNYSSYKQTNFTILADILGQSNIKNGRSYLDIAPAIQFIFFSKMRLDIGYRFNIINDLERAGSRSFLLRFEYDFFSVYKL